MRRGVRQVAGICIGTLAMATLAACGTADPGAPPASLGTVVSRPLPATITQTLLTDEHGTETNLGALRGKVVMVVPFLTLCTDICPLDTGNLLQVEHALAGAGLASRVELVELSIDPERDTPARLAAYAHLTGAHWEMVTESSADAARLEGYFGWVVQRVAEDSPPSIDWWTHQPLTYDVNHSDGFVVIDANGTERFSTAAAPDFHGTLNPTLHQFLNAQGRQHLIHPDRPSWTPAAALDALGWLLHRTIPLTGS